MPPSISNAWAPSPGKHQLNIGSSLGRALRARKGNGAPAPAKRNNLPEREFYSLRYGFKPSTIDSTKAGSLEVRRSGDGSSSSVTVEHASSQVYVFPGSEGPAKDWVCVLIYDEGTGGYTLEKLESSFALNNPEKRAGTTRPSHSPPAHTPDYSTPSAGFNTQTNGPDADLEEILPDSLLSSSKKPAPKTLDEDEEDIPLKAQVIPASAPPPVQPRKPLPQSRAPPSSSSASGTPKSATSKPAPKLKKSAKRATPTFSDAEEEQLEVGRPTKRARATPIPPPPAPEPKRALSPSRLELPGMSDAVVQPLPVPGQPKPSPSTIQPSAPMALSPLPPSAYSDSEEEDDWIEVAGHGHAPASAPVAPPVMEDEGGEEIDINEFETLMNAEMNAQMDVHIEMEEDEQEQEQEQEQDSMFGEDDFLAAAIPEEATPVLPKVPISLKQFVGGGDSADEDDYSSSDESDDD
ncbi:hypothetical protein GYMLUDRAFT_904360 [Collybiopsis luxurians FD-317 M1]|uniref:Transcription elongation factor Eaf N-terminal domain-containing protein n=1 Tax=Collybiopsis luxurians FD-317 M1 TaxID=944289 RepID=A0A0D0C8X7_9AGAR|nr:hypothetical protein GYMLUDRAFT_904360 [Collybiopsis luxurians FD-317 M1]